jgi:CRP-like cAMP-binding protein
MEDSSRRALWPQAKSLLFQDLSLKDLSKLASLCSDRVYVKDTVILSGGVSTQGVFLLNRGFVRISVIMSNGKEQIVKFLKNGDVFGENTLATSRDFAFQAIAHQDSWVSFIPRSDFLQLIQHKPVLALNFINILTQRLQDAYVEIGSLNSLNTKGLVARALLELARNHGTLILPEEKFTKISIPISHEILSHLIGRNRPNISNIMSDFKERGWVGYKGRELHIDVEAVKTYCDLNRNEADEANSANDSS